LRKEAHETAVVQIRIAMITFALFMIREIYCKLNSILGNPLIVERISDRIYSEKLQKTDLTEVESKLADSIFEEQRECRMKAKKKLPTWFLNQCLFASVPLEQCTSEATACAKASLFSGDTLLSITGGLGVDDSAFSSTFSTVSSLDPDTGLNAVVRFNNKKLGLTNIERLDTTAEAFLQNNPGTWSCIYADPDRRASGNRSAGNVHSYSPDIISLYHNHRTKAPIWLIKLSPMTDLSWFEQEMKHQVFFYIFSHRGEVKEILAVLQNSGKSGKAIISTGDGATQIFREEDSLDTIPTDREIFCEITSAGIKAGFRDYIIQSSGLVPASRHGYYLRGYSQIPDALGRVFDLKHFLQGSLGEISAQLNNLGIKQAHINTRDFVLPADETRKKLKIRDGGEVYLFFTGKDKVKSCFVTEKRS
jgi:hypothetical protein